MGEAGKDALRANPGVPGLRLEFHGVKVSVFVQILKKTVSTKKILDCPR